MRAYYSVHEELFWHLPPLAGVLLRLRSNYHNSETISLSFYIVYIYMCVYIHVCINKYIYTYIHIMVIVIKFLNSNLVGLGSFRVQEFGGRCLQVRLEHMHELERTASNAQPMIWTWRKPCRACWALPLGFRTRMVLKRACMVRIPCWVYSGISSVALFQWLNSMAQLVPKVRPYCFLQSLRDSAPSSQTVGLNAPP